MKTPGFLLLFLMFSFSCMAQEKNEKIKWSEKRDLTWEDFMAEPDLSSSYSANTNSGISYNWSYSTAGGEVQLEHEVFSNFYPNRSWVKPDLKDDEYLLEHERLHFDISELHARRLRKALSEYEPARNIRQDLKQIYNLIDEERRKMQKAFDKETNHSENREAETRWRKFIAAELEKFSEFAL